MQRPALIMALHSVSHFGCTRPAGHFFAVRPHTNAASTGRELRPQNLALFYYFNSAIIMKHRPDPEAGQEGKLRESCDRCHKLKNRCRKTGDPDGRCDRCERLDFDCVYRSSSRMGRPKNEKKTSRRHPTPTLTSITKNATMPPASTAMESLQSITVSGDRMETNDEDRNSPLQQGHKSPNKPQQPLQSRSTSSPDLNITVPT